MKKFLKTAAALAVAASMAVSASAYFPPSYDPRAGLDEDVNPNVTIETIAIPEITGLSLVDVTSSMASDDTDTAPLMDRVPGTTVTLAAADGASISMTAGEEILLGGIAVSKTDTAYTATLYATNDVDQKDWDELEVQVIEKDGYVVYVPVKLNANDTYRYFRLVVDTEEGDLTLETVLLYEAVELWPTYVSNGFFRYVLASYKAMPIRY